MISYISDSRLSRSTGSVPRHRVLVRVHITRDLRRWLVVSVLRDSRVTPAVVGSMRPSRFGIGRSTSAQEKHREKLAPRARGGRWLCSGRADVLTY